MVLSLNPLSSISNFNGLNRKRAINAHFLMKFKMYKTELINMTLFKFYTYISIEIDILTSPMINYQLIETVRVFYLHFFNDRTVIRSKVLIDERNGRSHQI